MSASIAVQKLVVAALAGIDGIGGVFDGPAPGAVPPYLVVGPDVVTEWSSKSFDGHEHRLGVTVWDAGPGSVRAKRLMADVEARLAGLAGPLMAIGWRRRGWCGRGRSPIPRAGRRGWWNSGCVRWSRHKFRSDRKGEIWRLKRAVRFC